MRGRDVKNTFSGKSIKPATPALYNRDLDSTSYLLTMKSVKSYTALAVLSIVIGKLSLVFGHGGVLNYEIGGQYYKGWSPYNSVA